VVSCAVLPVVAVKGGTDVVVAPSGPVMTTDVPAVFDGIGTTTEVPAPVTVKPVGVVGGANGGVSVACAPVPVVTC
jgi:hypothetical protein